MTKNNKIPSYLAELIPSEYHLYNTWNTSNIRTYSCRTGAFKYSFFHGQFHAPPSLIKFLKL